MPKIPSKFKLNPFQTANFTSINFLQKINLRILFGTVLYPVLVFSVLCPQTSVDDVVMLLKQQENFEKTLTAQDEKLHSLSDMANSLMKAGHRDRQWYSTVENKNSP